MTKNDPALKRYYKTVRSWLPCSRKQKKQILAQIQDNVETYLEQNPDMDFAKLEEHFGDPQTIAAAYVENAGTAEILRGLRIRRRIVASVVTAVILILILWGSIVGWTAVAAKKKISGCAEREILSTFYDDYAGGIILW